MDVRPTGLECFPPRPGGFRPLGFCMVVPLGVWKRVRAGHVLSAIAPHLRADESDHLIMSPRARAPPVVTQQDSYTPLPSGVGATIPPLP